MAVAWPYANGALHLGHMAGAYLPADIFARYHRLAGSHVLMVSGSDQHGTAITVRADKEGRTPQSVVDEFHPQFLRYWRELGISFDLFTTTGTPNHERTAQDIFMRLLERGHIYRGTSQQFYDPEAGRFLPDRYVEGTCPNCGYEKARGDQCDNCGRTLDPEELIDPRSRISGARPEMRDTEHYFFRLSAFQEPLLEWLKTREGWRKHVQNSSVGFVEEGLHDRSITRDLEWGVALPVEDLGPGKRIYVWFEAVIGYLSASKEWAEAQGQPEAWRAWWDEDAGALTYYFIGKDNIPFHTIIWPAILMAHGGLNLPYDVPANQFVTFKGEKASKSEGVGDTVLTYLERYQPDMIRYGLAANLPETSDTDLTEAEMVRRNNEELVATWGNLVNRVLSMAHKNFGAVPQPAALSADDEAMLAAAAKLPGEVGEHIEAVHLKAGLAAAMAMAQEANAYLNRMEPWKTAKSDRERTATTLWVALCVIDALKVALAPYLPFSSEEVHRALGWSDALQDAGWTARRPEPGTPLAPPHPLFPKIEVEPAQVSA